MYACKQGSSGGNLNYQCSILAKLEFSCVHLSGLLNFNFKLDAPKKEDCGPDM